MRLKKEILIIACTLFLVACAKKPKSESTLIYAGAGLSDVLYELVDSFEYKTGHALRLSLASSGTLARQIEQGGEPQVYISANYDWVAYLDSLGFIVEGSIGDVAYNDMVLIAPTSYQDAAGDSLPDLLPLIQESYLSMGNPAHVPAGKYAKQALEYYGLFSALDDHLLLSKDVRSALMVVEMEEAALGIVYRTDALRSRKVNILQVIPGKCHSPVRYVGSLCEATEEAKLFLDYIKGDETLAIWEKHGFRK